MALCINGWDYLNALMDETMWEACVERNSGNGTQKKIQPSYSVIYRLNNSEIHGYIYVGYYDFMCIHAYLRLICEMFSSYFLLVFLSHTAQFCWRWYIELCWLQWLTSVLTLHFQWESVNEIWAFWSSCQVSFLFTVAAHLLMLPLKCLEFLYMISSTLSMKKELFV